MAIKSTDLLDIVKTWSTQAKTECEYRQIASRAYYAAYHMALHDAENRSFIYKQLSTVDVHKNLREGYANHIYAPTLPDRKEKSDARDLVVDSLKKCAALRRRADYNLSQSLVKSDADKAIALADQLFNSVENC